MTTTDNRLETPRLMLRPWTLEDLPAFVRISNDPDVAAYTASFVYPQPEGWAQARLERMIASFAETGYTFAVTSKTSNGILGSVGIGLEAKRQMAELGYLCDAAWRGQGIIPEATRAVIQWAFTNLQLNRIQACHFARNPASGRVLEKCGLRFEGVLRGWLVKDGMSEDVLMYGILASDRIGDTA